MPEHKIKKVKRIKFNDGSDPYTITLAKDVTLTCCCANGLPLLKNYTSPRLKKFLANEGKNDPKNFSKFLKAENIDDENDLSLAWILEYKPVSGKAFRYFTAGDLSGIKASQYTNIEEDLLLMLDQTGSPLIDKNNKLKINVLKATHHGSKFSSLGESGKKETEKKDSKFLDRLDPSEIIIPCNNHHSLPYTEFFQRTIKDDITNTVTLKKIYLVNEFFRRAEGNAKDYSILNIKYSEYWSPQKGRTNILFGKAIEENKVDEYNREIRETIHRETVDYNQYDNTQIRNLTKGESYFKYYSNFVNNNSTGFSPKSKVTLPCFVVAVATDGTYTINENNQLDFVQGRVKKSRLKNELLTRIPLLIDKELLNGDSTKPDYDNCAFDFLLKKVINNKEDRNKIMQLYNTNEGEDFKGKYVLRKHNENETLVNFNKFLDVFDLTLFLNIVTSFMSANKSKKKSNGEIVTRVDCYKYVINNIDFTFSSVNNINKKRKRESDELSKEFKNFIKREKE